MNTRVNDGDTHIAAMRTLVRWVQTEGGLGDGVSNAKIGKIAEHVGLSRDQLNKFLRRNLSPSDEKTQHLRIAVGLRKTLEKMSDVPPHIAQIADDIYGENISPIDTSIVEAARVLHHKSLWDPSNEQADVLDHLTGLNFFVRRSTESVPAPTDDNPEAEIRGWSVSMLNVIPRYQQDGDYHPLFKLRQVSRSGNEIVVEGVVIVKSDRVLLEGMENVTGQSFSATIANSRDDWRKYRASERSDRRPARGVTIGLSNSRAPFAAPFLTFSIPNSVIPKNANADQKSLFQGTLDQTKAALGVRDLKESVEAMQTLGVAVDAGHLEQLRDRADRAQLFTLF